MCIRSERDDTYFLYKLPDETASHVPLYENVFPKCFISLNLFPLSTHTYSIRKKNKSTRQNVVAISNRSSDYGFRMANAIPIRPHGSFLPS